MFLKQYGERRSGTNALRALITANYSDHVVVLMHILGDKHSPPADLDTLHRDVQETADPAWEFVSRATLAVPSLTTRATSATQAAEMRRRAAALFDAFASGAFGYVISIRNPYTWAASLARFLRWRDDDGKKLAEQCQRFNERYRAWLGLLESPRRPATLVRHEDLLEDPEGVLLRVERTFSMRRSAPFRPVDGVVGPAAWDDTVQQVQANPFDRERRLRAGDLQSLTPRQRAIVTATIDWPLLRRAGYMPICD